MNLKTPQPQDVKGKKVLVRVDYNVPLKDKVIKDDKRIEVSLETIEFLIENGASQIILVSHLGRPKVEDGDSWAQICQKNEKFSLQVVAEHLGKLLEEKKVEILDQKVHFVSGHSPKDFNSMKVDPSPEFIEKDAQEKHTTQVLLLENLRFDPREKKNDPSFAQKLSKWADVYINDAFSVSHRAHASVAAVAELMPAFAGFALEREVKMLSGLTEDPARPFVVIVGGAKISDKVSAIENLTGLADTVLVGGGAANNFLKAEGFDVAHSYLQEKSSATDKKSQDFVQFADNLLDENRQEHTLLGNFMPLPKIIYPIDVVCGKNVDGKKESVINLLDPKNKDVDDDLMFLDIGPRTAKLFAAVIAEAKTIFWNGPMGVFENEEFSSGTMKVARAVGRATKNGAQSILGGGDTIAAIDKLGANAETKYTYISTAGGASLEFLGGKDLPGLKKLKN